MKFISICILLLSLMLFSEPSFAQTGGGYDLTWSTVDGGGGEASGGGFVLNGTLGQPDAGQLSGGGFVLNGGFWHPISGVPTAVAFSSLAESSASAPPFALVSVLSLLLALLSLRLSSKQSESITAQSEAYYEA